MTALSAANRFSNFRGTNEAPTEIASHIIPYVIVGAQQLSLGGGTVVRMAHYLVAPVSLSAIIGGFASDNL